MSLPIDDAAKARAGFTQSKPKPAKEETPKPAKEETPKDAPKKKDK